MKTIALMSLKGGTGKTTVTANLASALARADHACLAVDADPQDALGLHFGMAPCGGAGLLSSVVAAVEGAEVPYVPFGRCPPAALPEVEATLAADPGWLARRIESVAPSGCRAVLVDTPAGATVWTRQAVAAADLVLVVLLPDAASFATLPAVDELCASHARGEVFFLVNQVDARRRLGRDTLAALRGVLGERLLPVQITADEAVREALGLQGTVLGTAPASRAVADLSALAGWVAEHSAPAGAARTLEAARA